MNVDIFVRKPVFTAVFSLLLILFGLVSLQFLGVRETPNIQAPVITVNTLWVGADPTLIESDVTEILEREINGIEGIRTISSNSSEQQSTITIEFSLERDLEEAANDVRSRVSRARRKLPPDVEDPVVEKSEADAQPVMFLRLDAEGRTLLELSEIANTLVRERLQSVLGVSNVAIYGEQIYAIRIDLDPSQLASRGVAVSDIESALTNNNVSLPAGRIEGRATEMSIRLEGDLRTVDAFQKLVISHTNGQTVRLEDLGTVRLGSENERSAARSDGKATVTIAVLPQSNANIIDISDEVERRLPLIQAALPDDVKIIIGYDRSFSVRASIREVEETLLIAFFLVILVIFAFLRDWRSTLVPALAIPVSLIGTFSFLWLAGFSINVFTLFGLVLAIGLVVDDAIVVLENIYRHIEQGMTPYEASIVGTRQIIFAVIATTISLVAVFLPVLFTGGTSGRLFLEFGSTVAVSVLISAFVALTLTPMLSAKLLRPLHHPGKFYRITGAILDKLHQAFDYTLHIVFRFPILAFLATVITFILGGIAWKQVPQEFFPIEDRNMIMVRTLAPEGTSFEYMNARMQELEPDLMAAAPERTSVLSRVGTGGGGSIAPANTGMYVIFLVPKDERERSQSEVLASIRQTLTNVTAFQAIPNQPATVGRGFGAPVQFVLQHPDFEVLSTELPKFISEMRKIPGLNSINPDLKLNRPELIIRVDREKAAQLGVSIQEIGRALQVLSGGREISEFKRGNRQYPVIAQLSKQERQSPSDLSAIHIRSQSGAMIPLSNLIVTEEDSTAASRYHYDRAPSATISANLDGITLGEALQKVQATADQSLPDGFRTAYAGESKEFIESSQALGLVLLLAMVIVYLVLAAQFDSFLDPLSILLGAPLALAGAYGSLWITRTPLSFFSQVGLILLVGLITKNGILIVEYAKQLLEEDPHKSIWEVAEEAARLRFRPILMTSVATIGGALPIAIGFSSESRAPLGIVVVGGMLVATFLTLYVIPVAWATLARWFPSKRTAVTVGTTVVVSLLAFSARAAEPLSLEDALRYTAAHARQVAIASADIDTAKGNVGLTRANLLPQLNGTADASWIVDRGLTTPDRVGELSVSGRLTVPLFDLTATQQHAAAKHRLKAAEASENAALESALFDTASAFIEVQRSDQRLRTAEHSLERSSRLQELAIDRVNVGLTPAIDSTRAEFLYRQDQQTLLSARAARTTAEVRLADRMGTSLTTPLTVIPATPLLDLSQRPNLALVDAALQEAVRENPLLQAGEHSIDAAAADRRAATSLWLPTLDAYGSAGIIVREEQGAFSSTVVGTTLSLPLFNGLSELFATRRARAIETRTRLVMEDLDRSLEVELHSALTELDSAAGTIDVVQTARRLAHEELAFAEDRYRSGFTDNLPVLDAQVRVAEAEYDEVDAIAAYNLAWLRWLSAQGRLRELMPSDK